MSLSHAWRALRHRNFQLFFFGQSISVIGTWMTRVATGWLVYRLTHSTLLLGVVSFASQIVSFLLGPFAGVWVERMERRKMLVWTQFFGALQSLGLAAMALSGHATIWGIIVLASVQGLINAFDMPGRQSFIVQMVDDRADLSNAIAINSAMVNSARLLGPALAGIVIAATNEGWCFFIDGVSYFAVIASLLMMRLKPVLVERAHSPMFVQMREGWDYVRTFIPVRTILMLFAVTSLMGYPLIVLLPAVVSDVLHGGPHTLGWLAGASGAGALVSAIMLTLRKSVLGLTRMLPIAAAVLGTGMICFGLSHALWLSMLILLFTGFGQMQVQAASNTVIQSLVTDDKRARVMSYFTMTFFGSVPFGSLLAGALAHVFGIPHTLMFAGVCVLLTALWFRARLPEIRKTIRPVYEQMGLLPLRKAS